MRVYSLLCGWQDRQPPMAGRGKQGSRGGEGGSCGTEDGLREWGLQTESEKGG